MHQLILLRHAKSSWDNPDSSDFDRPLNPRGRRAAGLVRGAMRQLGLAPDMVLTSPAKRTLETLSLLEPWDDTPLIEEVPSLYLASLEQLLAVLNGVADTTRSVMLVGHNPGLHELALSLAAPASDALAGGVESLLSVIDYAKAQPFVNPARFILIGQSVGGFLTVGVTATAPPGLVAAVNFAGGHGGDPMRHPGVPCAPQKLLDVYSGAGKTARAPMLWVYTENDQYFGPDYARAWHAAFVAAGGHAELVLLSPFKSNGHVLFVEGMPLWQPLLDTFLASAGF